MAAKKKIKKVDDITSTEMDTEPKGKVGKSTSPFQIKAMDFKIPKRGILWYVLFTLFYCGLIVFAAYGQDWTLLVVALITSIVIIWRSGSGKDILLEVNEDSIRVNTNSFAYSDLENFYFSRTGYDPTVTIERVNKFYPRLTFVLTEIGKVEELRDMLQEKLPEKEPREESYFDQIVRKLKI